MTTTDQARRAAAGWEPPFGYTLSDNREFTSDNPASARYWADEPEDRSVALGWGYPTRDCAAAAAGRFLIRSCRPGSRRRWNNADIFAEVAPDSTGGGWGQDDPAELRETARRHDRARCAAGCATAGQSDPAEPPVPVPPPPAAGPVADERREPDDRTHCQPPGMRPTDPPEKRAYDWGLLARNEGDPPQPEDNPGYEDDYNRGYEGLPRQRRHRRRR